MNVPITFPPIAPGDLSDEPLIIKAEIEGYLARRVHVDEGRSEIKELGATPSIIHSMMEFPIPRGIATLVTRPTIRSECQKPKKKQIIEEQVAEEELQKIALTEEVLVNPNFPNQLVTIEGNLSPEGMNQLKTLLRNNQYIFAREPSDMTGKWSFSVEEGKFLGYMVISEGIRANPKKTKAIADVQSPHTWNQMQSLGGKLAALNRFLARSAERSIPLFETLKNITKDNKDEYSWTKEAEKAFQ
ncbi:hypothetical protein Tco_1131409 [Tanacetum coccineum]